MERDGLRPVWIGVLLALLVVTAPNWLFSAEKKSSYDAPWIYPADMPQR
jgi:hypothetical protein